MNSKFMYLPDSADEFPTFVEFDHENNTIILAQRNMTGEAEDTFQFIGFTPEQFANLAELVETVTEEGTVCEVIQVKNVN